MVRPMSGDMQFLLDGDSTVYVKSFFHPSNSIRNLGIPNVPLRGYSQFPSISIVAWLYPEVGRYRIGITSLWKISSDGAL